MTRHLSGSLASIVVTPPRQLNKTLYLDINNFSKQTAFAHSFMHIYALWLGLTLLAIVFVMLYIKYWFHGMPQITVELFVCGSASLIALLVNQFIGKVVQEKRPYDTFKHALVLVGKTSDYSFPSDHSVVAGALLTSVLIAFHMEKKYLLPAASNDSLTNTAHKTSHRALITTLSVLLALFLCFARVYVGAHYPGDVVAGFLEGAVIVALLSYLYYPLSSILNRKGASFLKIFFVKPRSHTPAT